MSLHAKFLDVSPTGVIKREQFTELITPLALKDVMHEMQDLSERYFDLFDVNGDGELSFAELLCGFSLFGHGSPSDKIESCFRLFDHSHSGHISRDELINLVVTHIRLSRRRPKYVDNPTNEYPRKVPVPGEFELPERSEVEAELKRTMEELFFQVDHNRNSEVSLDEFRRAVLNNADAQGYLVNLISVPDANEAFSYASNQKQKEHSASHESSKVGESSLSVSVSVSSPARASHSRSQSTFSPQSTSFSQLSRTSSRSSISLSSDGDFLRPRKRSGSYFARHVRKNSRSMSRDSSNMKHYIWEAPPPLLAGSSVSVVVESPKHQKPRKEKSKVQRSRILPLEGKEFETPDEREVFRKNLKPKPKRVLHERKKSGGFLQRITGGHSRNGSLSQVAKSTNSAGPASKFISVSPQAVRASRPRKDFSSTKGVRTLSEQPL